MMPKVFISLVVVLGLFFPPTSAQSIDNYLEWIQLSNPVELPESDDGTTDAIPIATPGFPFWDSVQTQVFVGTNGLISFGTGYNSFFNQAFPGSTAINTRYLVAPFWDNVDIRGGNGVISYQIFQTGDEINLVNSFLQNQTTYTWFEGTWMIVVFWDRVHPYVGSANPEENTFQAVLITDGVDSFTVFTYNCGLIEWDNDGESTIGFSAAGQVYANEDPSGRELACINGNASEWSNVIYNLSMLTDIPMEPAQPVTLDFINIDAPDGTLDSCDDCSEKILFSEDFPFGEFNHSQAYINDNGVISMPNAFLADDPSPFPTTSPDTYWPYSVAPFWSNADLRVEGMVKWKVYYRSDIDFSPVDSLVSSEYNTSYVGSWMLVVHWDGVHPFPHGDDQTASYNQKKNTFQAILTTDGTKSYAVFTYKCSSMEWANQPTIGTNAGGTTYNNHILTGVNYAFYIGCVHTELLNDTNNVVYDLVPNPGNVMSSQANPPYHTTIGSCAAANITSCCTFGSCLGEPEFCYCDDVCSDLRDCCYDAIEICPLDLLIDDYLIVAERESLDHIAYNGSGFEQIRVLFNGDAVGVDFHFVNNDVFWSDVNSDTINRAALDGTGVQYTLINSYISAVDDIAVDWIANNIYWVDAVWSRIEVADLNGTFRAEIIRVGANSNPRGIAVDPERRYMFWTDWGLNPKIERADMGGEDRQTIISDGLIEPFGITIDYEGLKIYWCDSGNNIIEYASLDGGGRTVLVQDVDGLEGLFSLTVYGTLLFWTDQDTNAVYTTHKLNGNALLGTNTIVVYSDFQFSIAGIEAVSSSRQSEVPNPCDGSECPELCLLSTRLEGYTCVSADDTPPATPEPGSCAEANYSECCTHGYCAGSPATCFCDSNCYDRGDCCMDVNVTCFPEPPRTPVDVTVSNVTATSATISWTIPSVLYTQEAYYVQYGLQSTVLDQTSAFQFSDGETTGVTYTITLQNLHPYYTYYFAVTSENTVSPRSTGVFTFTTLEAAPSGPPQNFVLIVTDNTVLTLSWDAPDEDMQNGDITTYTLNCTSTTGAYFDMVVDTPKNISLGVYTPFEVYSCTIYASTAVGPGPMATSSVTVPEPSDIQAYLPFIPLDILDSPDIVQFPETVDGSSDAIPLAPTGVPFGDSNQTTAYVGSNGLISFGSSYNSFFNTPFSESNTLYLVAPFWDDVDIRSDNGDIFYQTIESGLFLDQVNDFINYVRPTTFEATWMMVAYWVGVHPYLGTSNPEENTFQAIVATDGISTYAILTYKCGLMEWGSSATIGFTAAGNPFFNNDPSSNEIACINTPDSDWSNVVYLLSENSPELPPPSNLQFTDITNTSATVVWTIPFTTMQQNYTVLYGYFEDSVNITAGIVQGILVNQTYSLEVTGLDQATTYYVQVVSTFGIYTLYSDVVEFTTRKSAPYGAPVNFIGVTDGLGITFTWEPPPGGLLIDSYSLSCFYDDGSMEFKVQLNPVLSFTVAELNPSTTYTCTISASTTGGVGPESLAIQILTADFTITDQIYFPFIQLDTVYGVDQIFAIEEVDGTTGPIPIEPSFPFGSLNQSQFYVGTNGLLSFETPYNSFLNQQFPGSTAISSRYLVAPFWDDVDIVGGNGEISYEIHQSGYYLDEVNAFLQRKRPSEFEGTWMAVVYYDAVHPYIGSSNPEENTFQAILITDGTYSYAIFTYVCGLMEWDTGATIGYSAAGNPYKNYDPSTSEVACLNYPASNVTNVVFLLSESSPELEPPEIILASDITRSSASISFYVPRILQQENYTIQYSSDPFSFDKVSETRPSIANTSEVDAPYIIQLNSLSSATIYYYRVAATYDIIFTRYSEVGVFRTLEDGQAYYLQFLLFDDTSISSGTLPACDDCTSETITLPDDLPMGGYFHQSAFVSTNGLISLGRRFEASTPEVFPPTTPDTFWRYLVTPFWADLNSTNGGSVSYRIYTNENSSSLLNSVSQLIQTETKDRGFVGEWMLVGYWDSLPSPYLENKVNSFQGIIITNGSKSYAVYTYFCDQISWLDSATIGFNAPPSLFRNHPITGTELSAEIIACVHEDSPWNNVIYDLEQSPIILPVTPEPLQSAGSCRAAGFDTCCSTFFCSGSPPDCFCDTFCRFVGDCCYDFEEICPDGSSSDDQYDLLVANGQYIYTVHFQGNDSDVYRYEEEERNVGVDFYFGRSQLFWSDAANRQIYRADMDGSNVEVIVNESILLVEDIAVDWVSDKLFWVDAIWARVEAMDLNTLIRAEILRTGPNTSPRAIAVEPINRFIFWTDFGETAKIERSFMDGGSRRTLISSSLSQPNGITIDYVSERIYWTDSDLDKIEYANYDGTGRIELQTAETGLYYPFSVTVAREILFWTDWASGSIYATHKDDGDQGHFAEVAHFPVSTPYGIEALVSDRQPFGNNSCEMNNCSHICLMTSETELGYSCACPYGYGLETNGFECKVMEGSGSGDIPPPEGSCLDAGYNDSCCEEGYCAGNPATCFCDLFCYDRGDCCADIYTILCDRVGPVVPTGAMAISVTGSSAIIAWIIPYIELTSEQYTVLYGESSDELDQSTSPIPSYADITLENQTYTVTLTQLDAVTTYYFRVQSQNSQLSSLTEIMQFTTTEAAPSGPPQNFTVLVEATSFICAWDLPEVDDANGIIVSFAFVCTDNGTVAIDMVLNPSVLSITVDLYKTSTVYMCSVAASTAVGVGPSTEPIPVTTGASLAVIIVHPFIPPGVLLDSTVTYLPEADEGISDSIVPPIRFPFGDSNGTSIFVGTNGLMSFDIAYNTFFTQPFPGFVSSLYLLAPFWDDVDTIGGNGQIYYEVHETGHYVNQVNSFINAVRPSRFEGTWMLVVTWDAVHPFPGSFNSEENTFQVILISDGTYTYSIYVYFCGLLEWGNSPVIGYNSAVGDFDNYDPSSVDIACLNVPLSNWSNVVYRLSIDNAEFPLPEQVEVFAITMNSAMVSWIIPSLTEQQTYYVEYGSDVDSLNLQTDPITSATLLPDESYSVTLNGLDDGTVYYVRVVATFSDVYLYSSTEPFATISLPPEGPPLNFNVVVEGVSLTFSWEEPAGDNSIQYYVLACTVDGEEALRFPLQPILEITVEKLMPSTDYTCTIAAATSGGAGPLSDALIATTGSRRSQDLYLSFLAVGVTYGVEQQVVPEADDGTEGPISIEPGMPFGDSVQTNFFVGTNGLLSFGTSYNSVFNQPFSESSSISSRYLVAPFWDDVDTRGDNGVISYEVHESGYYLDLVNNFLQQNRPSTFTGTWMAIVTWDAVHPYLGSSNPEENTFQAILVTDGNYTYSIFIYKCGLLEWDNGAIIGFSAASNPYANHDPSSSDIACLNIVNSNFTNVVYRLSNANPEISVPQDLTSSNVMLTSAMVSWRIPSFLFQEQYTVEYGTDFSNFTLTTDPILSPSDTSITNMTFSVTLLGLYDSTIYYFRVAAVFNEVYKRYSEVAYFRTKEPEQTIYLPFFDSTNITAIDGGVLEICDDCSSSEILLPEDFPFGGYFHQTAFVNSNGLISFGRSVLSSSPELFPADSPDIFWSYIAAPFWSDVDTTINGIIYWEIHSRDQSASMLNDVSLLIQSQYLDTQFNGTWMLIATWMDVVSPTLTTGTFQAILVTDGSKSFAVFTYRCGYLEWTTPATIGLNAPTDLYYTHPLTGTIASPDEIACVHVDSEWNNVVIDMEPNPIILPITPEPSIYIGSCVAAGYSECCENGCFSTDCFCDDICFIFEDCCYDYIDICQDPTSPEYDLVVANGDNIFSVHYEGSKYDNLRYNASQTAQGVDFHYNRTAIFWSHSEDFSSTIHAIINMNDTMEEFVLVETNLLVVADIAVDWIANNLYWVDSAWARIEVLGLETLSRGEILRTGANTNPTAIAVDPVNRFMFWTDVGKTAQIERAFLDGSERRVLHNTNLINPVGITVDYDEGRIYWSDVGMDRIEFSAIDGFGRTKVETEMSGLYHPFALTVAGSTLFWTDWETNSVYATHKEHGSDETLGHFATIVSFPTTPYGIEAIIESKQPPAENSCETANCSHICLLTGVNELGFTCICPEGYVLEFDGLQCRATNESGGTPPPIGSCSLAGYTTCCTTGYCAGSPATCFCNPDCIPLGSCCSDFESICQEAPPESPAYLMAANINRTRADITWVVPSFTYGTETYVVQYGVSPDTLDMETNTVFSGLDSSLTNQQYSVTLKGLLPFTQYYFRVSASNILNTTSSDVATFTTINIGPPTNFEILAIGTETLVFSWSPPYDSVDTNIISYTLFCYPQFQDDISVTVPTAGTIPLEDRFLPGTTYTCSVYATNADGNGLPAEQTGTTLEGEGFLPFLVLGSGKVYLPYEDDAASESIDIIGGLSTGETVHTRAFVSTNGFISFDQSLLFWDSAPFPTSEYYIINSYMFAPFWSDIDIGRSGSVSYEVYMRGSNDTEDAILDRVNGFVSTETSSGFNGYWMMVAQWDAVHPFPHSVGAAGLSDDYLEYLDKENTFQAIIITNGTTSYAIYTYNCDLMGWSGFDTFATIGYNLNGGEYENHFLSGLESANTIACLSSPATKWNNLVYSIDLAAVSENQTQRSTCLLSAYEDLDLFGSLDDIVDNLESCPCSIGQAQVDPRFALYITNDELDCYVQLIPFGTSAQGCCYSTMNSTNGDLLTTGADSGSMLLYSPFLYSNESLAYDTSLRLQCCEAGLCDLYFARRPSDDCSQYQPLSWAWTYGDPHFRNLDGTAFTFNGQGEYTLVAVEESGFTFQGRTEPVASGNNQATRFTAFAFGVPETVVEVRVERGRMVVFKNQENITSSLGSDSILKNNVALALFDENNFAAVFSSAQVTHAISITLIPEIGYLAYALNLDNSQSLTTAGLLGVINGDTSDDFTYPDGTTIPPDSSDQMIHEWGQAWQITAQESLFFYDDGASTSNYSNPNFVPSFISDVVASAPDDITAYCTSNAECIFDYTVSGSQEVAASTLQAYFGYTSQENQASTFPPKIYAMEDFTVNIGIPSTYDLMVEGGQLSVLGDMPENSILIEDSNTSGLYHFTWTLSNPTADPITFIATDSQGGLAALSPLLLLCACENRGSCTDDGFLGSQSSVITLQCDCPEAWGGRFCTEDFNGCSQIHCFPGIQCSDVVAPEAGHMCGPCPSGFLQELEKCADIDECSRQDTNDCQQSCTNTFGSYKCTCIEGYQPDPSDMTTCIDVDECDIRTDDCEQLCINTDGSYTCDCMPGFTLNSDRATCDPQAECPQPNDCSDICTLVGGTPGCSCSRGYELINDTICQDINECSDNMLCEQVCNNTLGSFSCSCNIGYTIDTDGRSCNDINECSSGPVCPEGRLCVNTPGNFTCVCPEGTMLNSEGTCETIPVVEPTKVVVVSSTSTTTTSPSQTPTSTSSLSSSQVSPPPPFVTPTPDASYSLTVTIAVLSAETFSADRQLQFRKIAAEIISECCSNNSDQCQVVKTKQEVVSISENNVFIINIKNGSDGKSVQFTLFVTTSSDSSSLLKPESTVSCLKSGEDKLKAAGFSGITYEYSMTDTGEQQGKGGLSGGAIAGIVIAVIFVVVAIGAVAAFILFRMKRRGKYNVSSLLSERMGEFGSSEKKDLSTLMMSTEEEGEL